MRLVIFNLLFIVLSFGFQVNGQILVKGCVFEDKNGNMKRESGETGIANVGISNGSDVVTTNQNGEYSIHIQPGTILFVIQPSGFAVPVNAFNQPQFFYAYKPNGSPKLKYRGADPTGSLPATVDFPLIPKPHPDVFKILVLGDPQPYNEREVGYFGAGIVSEFEGSTGFAFGISLGDLVGDDLNLFPLYKNAIAKAGIPWYNVMGNHDMNYDVRAGELSDETFEKEFGPNTYSFNFGKAHFIVLDDILYPDPRDSSGYWGGITEKQFRFIENDLKHVSNDHLIVIAFHIPISEREGGDPFRDEDRLRLFSILKPFQHTLTLSAHTHFQSQDFFGPEDGWKQDGFHHHYNVAASCGDWYSGEIDAEDIPVSTMRDGTPKGYAMLTISNNRYTLDYKVAGKPEDYRMRIHNPRIVARNQFSNSRVYVNYFMGGQFDSLFCRVGNGAWKPMRHTEMVDPAYSWEVFKWDFTEVLLSGRRPSDPVDCNHLWTAQLPVNLPVGEHFIEIKVKDMFGRTFLQKSAYRILPEIRERE